MIARRVIGAVVFVVIVLVGTAIARPAWAMSAGLDVWNMPALREEVAASVELGRELEAEDSQIFRHIEVKEQLIRELIAGRIALADATTQFVLLDHDYPEYMIVIRQTLPGATDFEKMARNVLVFAEARLENEPALRRVVILARLDAELRVLSESSLVQKTN